MHIERANLTIRVVVVVVIPLILIDAAATVAIFSMVLKDAFARDGIYSSDSASQAAAAVDNSCLNPIFDSNTIDNAFGVGNCGNTVSQQAEGGEASSPITVQTASPKIEVQAPPPSPEEPVESPQACRECFFASLTDGQLEAFREAVSDITLGEVSTIEELCTLLEENPDSLEQNIGLIEGILRAERVDASTVAEIIDCLERVFGLQM
jgi:hypothetical protein